MGSPSAEAAEAILRDFSNFQWYMIPFLLVVIYMIAKEVQKENWSALFAAVAFWLADWINEIWNGLIYHFTDFAPFWSTPPRPSGPNSSLVILIGLNIEITFMFLMMGFVSTKMFKGTIQEELRFQDLTEQKLYRRKRIVNRVFIIMSMSLLCVIVEIILNLIGILVWDWNGVLGPNVWSLTNPILIYLVGYVPFWTISAFVYDMKKRISQIITVGSMALLVIVSLVVFILIGWI